MEAKFYSCFGSFSIVVLGYTMILEQGDEKLMNTGVAGEHSLEIFNDSFLRVEHHVTYGNIFTSIKFSSSINKKKTTFAHILKINIMKKITLLCASLLCVFNLLAQGTESSQKHSSHTVKQLNFGLIGASFEFPVQKNITVAPAVGTDFNLDWLALGVKANFYFDNLFDLTSPWDVYAGANAGYAISTGDNSKNSDFNIGLQVGGRWFWNDKWGVFLEFGGGNTMKGTGGVGITMKL